MEILIEGGLGVAREGRRAFQNIGGQDEHGGRDTVQIDGDGRRPHARNGVLLRRLRTETLVPHLVKRHLTEHSLGFLIAHRDGARGGRGGAGKRVGEGQGRGHRRNRIEAVIGGLDRTRDNDVGPDEEPVCGDGRARRGGANASERNGLGGVIIDREELQGACEGEAPVANRGTGRGNRALRGAEPNRGNHLSIAAVNLAPNPRGIGGGREIQTL